MKWETGRFEGARLVDDAGRIIGRVTRDTSRDLETWLAYALPAGSFDLKMVGAFTGLDAAQKAVENFVSAAHAIEGYPTSHRRAIKRTWRDCGATTANVIGDPT